jgi:hypothetical protein
MSDKQYNAPEPGVMHEIDEAFYKYTIQQRDSAWREIERLTAERDQVLKQLEQLRLACDERGGVLLYLDTLATDFAHDGFVGAAREAAAFAEVIRDAMKKNGVGP